MKRLGYYNTYEMLDWFDKIYKEAKRQFEFLKEHGYIEEGSQQYTWEMVIELLGKDIWKEWNKYQG